MEPALEHGGCGYELNDGLYWLCLKIAKIDDTGRECRGSPHGLHAHNMATDLYEVIVGCG